jgi:hypothetical protein
VGARPGFKDGYLWLPILDPSRYGASVQLTRQTDFNRQVFALQFHPVQFNRRIERLEYLLTRQVDHKMLYLFV